MYALTTKKYTSIKIYSNHNVNVRKKIKCLINLKFMNQIFDHDIWKTGCHAGPFIQHTCKATFITNVIQLLYLKVRLWFLYPCNSCCIFRRKSNYIGLLSNFLPTCFSYSSINRTALFIYSDFGVVSILGKLHNVQDSLKD